jgi:hypothetical protein
MEEKRRITYTGPGLSMLHSSFLFFFLIIYFILVVPERTEVDESLLKNIDVPFGIWLYKYVRLYVCFEKDIFSYLFILSSSRVNL